MKIATTKDSFNQKVSYRVTDMDTGKDVDFKIVADFIRVSMDQFDTGHYPSSIERHVDLPMRGFPGGWDYFDGQTAHVKSVMPDPMGPNYGFGSGNGWWETAVDQPVPWRYDWDVNLIIHVERQ